MVARKFRHDISTQRSSDSMAESLMEHRREGRGDDSHTDDRRLAVLIGHDIHFISLQSR